MTVYNACVYIDGLNFYRDIVHKIKNNEIYSYPSLKCLCEQKLASFPLKKHEFTNINIEEIYLNRVRYFTAMVAGTNDDLNKSSRQEKYIDALEREGVEVILGEHKKDATGKKHGKKNNLMSTWRHVLSMMSVIKNATTLSLCLTTPIFVVLFSL